MTQTTTMTGYEFKKLHMDQFYIYEVWRSSLFRDTLFDCGMDSMKKYQQIFTTKTYFPYYEYYVKEYMMLTKTSGYSYCVYTINIPDSATVIIEKNGENEVFRISKIEKKGDNCQFKYLNA